MLVRFAVENFRSIRNRVDVSFLATRRREEPSLVFESRPPNNLRILPVMGIWGPNASGKSNILVALRAIRMLIDGSFREPRPDAKVAWEPWRLAFVPGKPGRAELEFLFEDDALLSFGFEVDGTGFSSEWLHRYVGKRRQVVYERERAGDGAEAKDVWRFGRLLGRRRRLAELAEATRANALFLSTAGQLNEPLLRRVQSAVGYNFNFERPLSLQGFPIFGEGDPILDREFRPALVRVLGAADLGIKKVDVAEVELPRNLFTKLQPAPAIPQFELRMTRAGDTDADDWHLGPEHESQGTNILLARLSDIRNALRHGQLLVADEIDTSLHPDLCAALVGLFTDPRTNPKGAQLLFATHSRDLLTRLRSDEVLLVEKGPDGSTTAASAAEFKTAGGRGGLRRAHELGRVGAVPLLGDIADAFTSEHDVEE